MSLGDMEVEAGSPDQALGAAHRDIAINNLREEARCLEIRAWVATGDALKHHQHLSGLLKREASVAADGDNDAIHARVARNETGEFTTPRQPSPES
jgi:hypothetical protein